MSPRTPLAIAALSLLLTPLPACRNTSAPAHPPGASTMKRPGKKTTPAATTAPTPAQVAALARELEADVTALAGRIGPRHVGAPAALKAAHDMLVTSLTAAGWSVERQTYTCDGVEVANLYVELRGSTRPDEVVVVGAHYDTVRTTPGADDNASGVAGVLALARWIKAERLSPARTLRLLLFVNEEPPYFYTEQMGSLVYARACASRGDKVVAMISLEMLGFYSDAPKSQTYPPVIGALYPKTGNFLGFVSNPKSAALLRQARAAFAAHTDLPTEAITAPEVIEGVGFSDHWSFWQAGYPAIMLTDTAFFRNPHYHEATDTPDRLDYPRFARAMFGVYGMVRALVA